jgi:hypothetical protein
MLTDDDLMQIEGDYDKFTGPVQKHYADHTDEVHKWADTGLRFTKAVPATLLDHGPFWKLPRKHSNPWLSGFACQWDGKTTRSCNKGGLQ